MNNLVNRTISQKIKDALFKDKVVIVYGARQVGKTTLVKQILQQFPQKSLYLNCDEPDIRQALTDRTSTELKQFLGDSDLVVLDEAQRVKNIGLTLKLLIDNYPRMQVMATGSSSFDLSNEISEPLTGRKKEFHLFPFSIEELQSIYSNMEINRILEDRMIMGMYPEVIEGGPEAGDKLKNLSQSYTYKDVLQYQNIKNPEVLVTLLQALALQVGSEVSYNELAETTGVNKKTVESYIQILEKAFVIFRLRPFSRNLRNELKKLRKIYFYDNGVRNALINNFNPLNLRGDKGALWENFMISERVKYNSNNFRNVNHYFWRTWGGKEIDLVEESEGGLHGYELKFNKDSKIPKEWKEAYPDSNFGVVNKNNYFDFISSKI